MIYNIRFALNFSVYKSNIYAEKLYICTKIQTKKFNA